MMNSIVIYGSHYGTTQQYAEELAKRINLKCLNFKEVTEINDYDEIIYLGGLYAGGILGMEKTFKKIYLPSINLNTLSSYLFTKHILFSLII